MIRKILKDSGNIIDYTMCGSACDQEQHLLSPHVHYDEIDCAGDFIISERILKVFEDIRHANGDRPILINSGYRSAEKQDRLRDYYTSIGKKQHTAVKSPHTYGLALDLNTNNTVADTDRLLEIIRKVRDEKHPYLRIGWQQYRNEGDNFIHIDVAPFFYGPNGACASDQSAPEWWRTPSEW